MSILVISTSLSPMSRSRILAQAAHKRLLERASASEFVDLATLQLPLCDGSTAYDHPSVVSLCAKIAQAAGVLLAFPIYNYDAAASCKNLLELTGQAWEGKVVGLMAAAGGAGSYMAPMQIANSLMLDFRCVIVPRIVYSSGEVFEGDRLVDDELIMRIDQLADEVHRIGSALAGNG